MHITCILQVFEFRVETWNQPVPTSVIFSQWNIFCLHYQLTPVYYLIQQWNKGND